MTIEATIIADSVNQDGGRLTTFVLKYPRFVHDEFMTHRAFSRSASSSRAVPIKRMLANIKADPASPVEWGKNRPGMQASENLSGFRLAASKWLWFATGWGVRQAANIMRLFGAHKQIINRMLEPWAHISVVVTGTEWENFFALRCHKDADPTFKALARLMFAKLDTNSPESLDDGEWHLPFISDEDRRSCNVSPPIGYQVSPSSFHVQSVARCARVSYLNHDREESTYAQDRVLFVKLSGDPVHASPFEHQATPCEGQHMNLKGWKSLRASQGY